MTRSPAKRTNQCRHLHNPNQDGNVQPTVTKHRLQWLQCSSYLVFTPWPVLYFPRWLIQLTSVICWSENLVNCSVFDILLVYVRHIKSHEQFIPAQFSRSLVTHWFVSVCFTFWLRGLVQSNKKGRIAGKLCANITDGRLTNLEILEDVAYYIKTIKSSRNWPIVTTWTRVLYMRNRSIILSSMEHRKLHVRVQLIMLQKFDASAWLLSNFPYSLNVETPKVLTIFSTDILL